MSENKVYNDIEIVKSCAVKASSMYIAKTHDKRSIVPVGTLCKPKMPEAVWYKACCEVVDAATRKSNAGFMQ